MTNEQVKRKAEEAFEIVEEPPKKKYRKDEHTVQGQYFSLLYSNIHNSVDQDGITQQIEEFFGELLDYSVILKEVMDETEFGQQFKILIVLHKKIKINPTKFKLLVIDADGDQYKPAVIPLRNKGEWLNLIIRDNEKVLVIQ